MANPTATIVFSGVGSVTLRAAPGPIPAPTKIPSYTNRAQGGSLVLYEIGPAYEELTLNLTGLNNSMASNLRTFFASNKFVAAGFNYVDPRGVTHTAWFLDDSVPLQKDHDDSWSCSVHLQVTGI